MARTRNLSLKHPTGLNVSPKTKRYSLVMQPDHRTTKQGLKLANNSWLLKFKSSDQIPIVIFFFSLLDGIFKVYQKVILSILLGLPTALLFTGTPSGASRETK